MDEKQRNLLIAILIVLLIGALFFYSNKDTELDLPEGDNSLTLPEEDNTVVDEKEDTTEVETEDPVVVTDPNKAKFDLALTNASQASLDGDYAKAIVYLNEALTYKNSDVVYIRLYSAYNSQGNVSEAINAINKAIELNPPYTDYWTTKLVYLDEKTSTTYAELANIYQAGKVASESRTKINLVTSFARIAEANNQYQDAIDAWEEAKALYPDRVDLYQAEIDRLKAN